MGCRTVAVWLTCITRAAVHAKEEAAWTQGDELSAQQLTDSFVDRAFKQVQAISAPELDYATLGKSGQSVISSPARTASLPAIARPYARAPPSAFGRPDHRRSQRVATPAHQRQTLQCSIQERVDPNWTPGAVKNLRTEDKPEPRAFNRVQVRVYNIDRYGMSPLAAAALKKNIEAIWHVGVAVFGKEYWFGAVVESQDLGDVDYAFGFGPTHVYDIGTTDVDPAEFDKWVFEELAPQFDVESYDCFNHNCHHFANDLVMKLTGKTPETGGFPQWCLDHGEKALSELPDAQGKTITWVSNRIAKVMMISWGKYNRERFVDANGDNAPAGRTSMSAA